MIVISSCFKGVATWLGQEITKSARLTFFYIWSRSCLRFCLYYKQLFFCQCYFIRSLCFALKIPFYTPFSRNDNEYSRIMLTCLECLFQQYTRDIVAVTFIYWKPKCSQKTTDLTKHWHTFLHKATYGVHIVERAWIIITTVEIIAIYRIGRSDVNTSTIPLWSPAPICGGCISTCEFNFDRVASSFGTD